MKLYGFGLPHHDHHHTGFTELSGLGIFSILAFSIAKLHFLC
jgi:hypothetical protein